MSKCKTTQQSHAEHSGKVMETRDHIKNGVSPKNHRSRGNFLRIAGFVLLASCIIFNGCKKDDDKNGANEKVYLVTEISGEDGSTTFEYDAQNRITKMISDPLGNGLWIETLSYNNAGDLVSYELENCYGNSTRTFIRNGNIITIHDSQWNDEWIERNETLEVNSEGLLLKRMVEETYDDSGSYWWWKDVYIFQYQDKNLIKVTTESESCSNGEIEKYSRISTFSYDDKKSPFYHCKTPEWFWIDSWSGIHNNVKTINWSDGKSLTCEYTYNDAGFPLTRKVIHDLYDKVYEYTLTFKYGDPSEAQVSKNALHETPSRPDVGNAPPKRNIWKPFSHRFDI